MEEWLTTTIPGIVLLGAAGSILAVGLLAALRLIPAPIRWHRRRTTKQAYMLGYSAAMMDHDETGRNLVSFMTYHVSLMLVYLTLFLFSAILFAILIAIQSEISITWSAFISCSAAFTLLYLSYFEFEYINRTYLFYWKASLKRAATGFAERGQGTVEADGNPKQFLSSSDDTAQPSKAADKAKRSTTKKTTAS